MPPPVLRLLIILILSPHVSSYTLLKVQALKQNCYLVCNCCSIGFCTVTVYIYFPEVVKAHTFFTQVKVRILA